MNLPAIVVVNEPPVWMANAGRPRAELCLAGASRSRLFSVTLKRHDSYKCLNTSGLAAISLASRCRGSPLRLFKL